MYTLIVEYIQNFKLNLEKRHPNTFPFILMLFSTLSITCSQTFLKLMHEIPAYQLVMYRGLMLLIINYPQLKQSQHCVYTRKPIYKLIMYRSLCASASLMMGFQSLQILKIQEQQTIWLMNPIWSLFLSKILGLDQGKQIFTIKRFILILVNFLGMILIINPSLLLGSSMLQEEVYSQYETPSQRYLGIGLAFMGSITFAFTSCLTSKIKNQTGPPVLLQYFYFAGVVLGGLAMLVFGMNTEGLFTPKYFVYLILVAIFSYIAQFLFCEALMLKSAGELMPIQYCQIIVSFFLDYFLFTHQFSFVKLIGSIIIIFACISIVKLKS